MPIKLTVREAIAAHQAIERMPKLPDAKISYQLGRIGDFCEQEARRAQKEQQKLQREAFGPRDKDGIQRVLPGKQDGYLDAVEAIMEQEAEIPREPVTLDQVLGPKEDQRPQIEPSLWRALGKIVLEAKP